MENNKKVFLLAPRVCISQSRASVAQKFSDARANATCTAHSKSFHNFSSRNRAKKTTR